MANIMAMTVDSREDGWIKAWQASPPALLQDIPIMVDQLPNGDARIWCQDGYVLSVERKTPSDFLSSIPTDHIFDQAARMVKERLELGYLPFLVVTGEMLRNPNTGMTIIPGSRHGDGWNWNAVQGALLTIQEAGVPVVFCAGDMDYARCLDWLAGRNHGVTVINPSREIMALTPQERVLCGFPGIGPELAGDILKKAGSLAWAIDWLCDLSPTCPKIPGIALGRKQVIVKTLELDDGNTLGVYARNNN